MRAPPSPWTEDATSHTLKRAIVATIARPKTRTKPASRGRVGAGSGFGPRAGLLVDDARSVVGESAPFFRPPWSDGDQIGEGFGRTPFAAARTRLTGLKAWSSGGPVNAG